ncbi:hypothetical protein GCM10009775_21060 [Microbacterium aoyamense]|uniref:DUF559 domain-containing protein n=1 Tax=Microbacterium aoyamense TaxID=344166 RepID=A0ABN2PQD2_9MICO|nr:DUF559 domain-containing protein [Microbacterium aoyamense]
MDISTWIAERGGIAHRADVIGAGFGLAAVRSAMKSDEIEVVRRAWLVQPAASPDVVAAARAGGRVACVSLARRRGWWMPDGVDERLHLRLAPDAGSPRNPKDWDGVVHWTKGIAPVAKRSLEESPEDALAHIATCLPHAQALVVWESAMRCERLSPEVIRAIVWPTEKSRRCASEVNGLSDSGLETIFASAVRSWGVALRQQIVLAGKPVDILIGDRLVVQIDGYAHHSSSAQRTKDIAHDAELRLRGYTVLRFSYAQVIHDWALVERTVRRALASRLHLAD